MDQTTEFRIRVEETAILLELTVRVAARVANYEKVSFRKEDADHERFRTNVTRLCSSILMALAKSAHQIWSLRVDFILRALSKDWMKDLQEFETIKHLDESCKEQVASIRSSKLAAAEERLILMESEMEERVQTEVASQLTCSGPAPSGIEERFNPMEHQLQSI